MINYKYQVITAKGDARQVLYVARNRKEAVDYIAFLLNHRDFNEALEYIIRPVTVFTDDPVQKQAVTS